MNNYLIFIMNIKIKMRKKPFNILIILFNNILIIINKINNLRIYKYNYNK